MKKNTIITLLTFSILLFGSNAFTQDYVDTTKTTKPIPTVLIKTKDGTRLSGKIIKSDGKSYSIQTQNLGIVSIPTENVVSIQQVNYQTVNDSSGMFEPLSNTNYFLNQSGFNLKQGDIRYSNIYLVYNSFNFGLSDNFSANVGFIFSNPTIINVGAKYAFKASEKVRFGLAGNYILSTSYSSNIGFGVLSATGTFGTDTKNISVGATWGVSKGSIFSGRPAFQLSGITRVSRRVALITDNILTTTERYSYNYYSTQGSYQTVVDGAVSYGIRLLYPRTQLDFGLLRPIYDFGTVAFPVGLPYFKLTTALNKRK
jgi:hypothetical protein